MSDHAEDLQEYGRDTRQSRPPHRGALTLPLLGLVLPLALLGALLTLQHQNGRLSASLTVPSEHARAQPFTAPLPLGSTAPPLWTRDAAGELRGRVGSPGRPLALIFTQPPEQMCGVDWRSLAASQAILDRYHRIGLTAAIISESSPSGIAAKLKQYGIHLPVLADVDRRTETAFHVDTSLGMELFLVGPDDDVAFRHGPPVPTDDIPLPRYLATLSGRADSPRKEELQ